jgi:hypothetical protein
VMRMHCWAFKNADRSIRRPFKWDKGAIRQPRCKMKGCAGPRTVFSARKARKEGYALELKGHRTDGLGESEMVRENEEKWRNERCHGIISPQIDIGRQPQEELFLLLTPGVLFTLARVYFRFIEKYPLKTSIYLLDVEGDQA